VIKRAFDLLVVLISSPVLLLIFLVSYFLILFSLGRPIFFRQDRPGKYEKIFKMYKFRTMTTQCDADGELLPDEKRVTQLGQILRSTSIDELPALWNVLKGDMSLVGPRPLLIEYLPLYNEFQKKRHLIKPGLTGWAQVNGRNAITWEEKFQLDLWYVENQSIWLDLKIIWMTFFKVIKREDISANDHVTMPKFVGGRSGKRNS